MRLIFACAMLLGAAPLASEEGPWAAMSGAQITQALTDRSVHYASATQDFRVSGRTLYNAGRDSWGYWAVRGDQYCSLWPPQDLWECYDMAQNGDQVQFIGSAGDITTGTIQP